MTEGIVEQLRAKFENEYQPKIDEQIVQLEEKEQEFTDLISELEDQLIEIDDFFYELDKVLD